MYGSQKFISHLQQHLLNYGKLPEVP